MEHLTTMPTIVALNFNIAFVCVTVVIKSIIIIFISILAADFQLFIQYLYLTTKNFSQIIVLGPTAK